MRKVVITGLGAITPIGNNVEKMWESVKAGVCGIAPITHYDTTDRKVTLAGEVKDFAPEEYLDKQTARKSDRYTQFALVAAKEAVTDSGLDFTKEDTNRCGVLVSSGIGGLTTIEAEDKKGLEKGHDRVSPYFIPMAISNMAAGNIAIEYGLHGMASCVVTACAGGSNAIGDAYRLIKDGYADVMLAGGAEASICSLGIGGFSSLKALSTATDPNRASIPFDAERSGFVMGEGAGILILEEYEHAVNRGAKIYAELGGYWSNCDAHHITAPLEDGHVAADCMRLALKDAGVEPTDITYINAHGTSTHLNDAGETKAIRNCFGEYADSLYVSSTKAMTGHLLGASGAIEAVITTLAVKENYIPATINYKVADPECDLNIIPNTGVETEVKNAMSNNLGFGGHNASLVFKKAN